MNADCQISLDDAVTIISGPASDKHDWFSLAQNLTDWVVGELGGYLDREHDADLIRNVADLVVLGMIKQHDQETATLEGVR